MILSLSLEYVIWQEEKLQKKKKTTRVSNFVLQIQKSIGAATTESDFRKNKPTVASCQGSADDVWFLFVDTIITPV